MHIFAAESDTMYVTFFSIQNLRNTSMIFSAIAWAVWLQLNCSKPKQNDVKLVKKILNKVCLFDLDHKEDNIEQLYYFKIVFFMNKIK